MFNAIFNHYMYVTDDEQLIVRNISKNYKFITKERV